MRLLLKREIMKTLNLMKDMQKVIEERRQIEEKSVLFEWFAQLQEAAMEIGQTVEEQDEPHMSLISGLEEYCEIVYRLGEAIVNGNDAAGLWNNCNKKLLEIWQYAEQLDVKIKVAFLPYKYSMWDCMESIWKAACEDKNCDCQVIPVPYYDREQDGSLGKFRYEGDFFPEETGIMDYQSYDLEAEQPDIVYIHNPYDEYNKVTCIAPAFFMEKIKKCGAVLVYVPYYLSGYCLKFDNMASSCRTKGAFCSDYIILQSEKLKAAYEHCGITGEKLIVTGSPKIDKMCELREKGRKEKDEWRQMTDGKKVLLLNSGLSTFLNQEDWLGHVDCIVEQVLSDKDMVLIWRPHPLLAQTIRSLQAEYLEEYEKICKKVETAENGILDLSEDYMDAVAASDGMISDYSSLVLQYTFSGKPVLLLSGSSKNRENEVFCDYFSNYFVSDGTEVKDYIDMIKSEKDNRKDERIRLAEKSVVNADGTCGRKTHNVMMRKIYC